MFIGVPKLSPGLSLCALKRQRDNRVEPSYPIPSLVLQGAGSAGLQQCGVLGNSRSHGGDGHPKVPTSPPTTLQELKHKILLKGKKIGRLEDTLDGPGDEAPDASDDDNGAEAEEERRKVKVGGPGWGLAGSTEPLDAAMGCGNIPVPRGEAETSGTLPGKGNIPFCPWPCQPPLCTASLWCHRGGGPVPPPFLAGRLPVVAMLAPPAMLSCSGLYRTHPG